MSIMARIIIITVLIAAVAGVLLLKGREPTSADTQAADTPADEEPPALLPRFVEIGRGKCEACKMMVPVLAELRTDYKGQLQVESINLDDDPAIAEFFAIHLIPTQIFFDANGQELDRHEGFMPKADVVAKWKALGVELTPPARAAGETPRPGLMRRVATALTHAVEGNPAVALAASFVWGILSILLSPCHLTSIPLIVGFIDKQGRTTTRRAFLVSTLFAVGILVTIGAVGAITAAAGRIAGDVGSIGNYIVAALFFLVALVLLDVVPMPWSGPGQVGMKKKGMLAALILGLVFGIAIGPCTFAYMAPMLGVVFKLAAAGLVYGIVLLVAYGVGHCSVIVLAGTFTEVVQRYLNWNERSKGAVIVKRVCGALVALGGLYLIYTAV